MKQEDEEEKKSNHNFCHGLHWRCWLNHNGNFYIKNKKASNSLETLHNYRVVYPPTTPQSSHIYRDYLPKASFKVWRKVSRSVFFRNIMNSWLFIFHHIVGGAHAFGWGTPRHSIKLNIIHISCGKQQQFSRAKSSRCRLISLVHGLHQTVKFVMISFATAAISTQFTL